MRNATVTTIAPTGTISIIAGTSSGIEPLFAISFVRRVLAAWNCLDINPRFRENCEEQVSTAKSSWRELLTKAHWHISTKFQKDVKKVWVCSHDIPTYGTFACKLPSKNTSTMPFPKQSTFPQEATIDDVHKAYMAAWQQGLKGITVYRDASRSSQVLNIGKSDPLKNIVVTPIKKAQSAGRSGTATSPRTSHDHNFNKQKRQNSASATTW